MNRTRQTSWQLRLTAAIVLLLTVLASRAQIESDLTFRRYTTLDGLPQMQAETVWQDSRGYIYIGTLSGFVRFDGRTFTPFLKGKRKNIVGFVETSDGVCALSFRRQWLINFDETTEQLIDPEGHWLLNNFNATDLTDGYVLLEDENEQNRHLCLMTAEGFVPQPLDEQEGWESSLSSLEGQREASLDNMTPDRHLYIDSIRGLLIPTGKVYSYRRCGQTLYAFAQDGIYAVEDDSLRLLTPFSDWSASYGLLVRDASDGTFLIADEHSLYSYDGQEIRKLAGGFNLVKGMLVDRWDRLWLATYQGVYCFFNRHFTSHRLTDEDDIVRAVAVKDGRKAVMGTLNGKIIYDGHVIYDEPENFFLPSSATIDNRTYMAGRDDVACIGDSTITWLQMPFERYQFVTSFQGKLIMGTRQLIAAYDPATGSIDTLSADIAHPWCAAADGEGRLWVGSTYGLYNLSSSNVGKAWEMQKVDYHNQTLIITTMEADQHGTVFFASGDSLFSVSNGKVQELNSQLPQLEGHEVRSLHVSPRGFLVVAAIDGLFVCRVSENQELSDICFFDHTNGFTMIEPLKARMAEDADGTVWLCGVEGMLSFKPEELVTDSQADTFIRPPLRWWQHAWVWIVMTLLLVMVVWALTRWYEKHRSRKKMLRLQREKMEKERLIQAIREEAIKAEKTKLAKDIVKMTERNTTEKLTLRTVPGSAVVATDDIVYLKADGNYTLLVTFHGTETVLTGLGALAKMLKAPHFVRADRSTVVNIRYISRMNATQRRCFFRSENGQELETTLLTPAFKRLEEYLY